MRIRRRCAASESGSRREQLARVRQRAGVVAAVLGRVGAAFEPGPMAPGPALALLLQPGGQLGAELAARVAEHVPRVGEVVLDAGGQRQGRAASDQLDAELSPELEQALAQGVPRRLGRALRPEQGRQPGARRRPLERQPGEQRGITRGQRRDGVVGAEEMGRVGELQAHGGGSVDATRRAAALEVMVV
jgi:hypothetical protein